MTLGSRASFDKETNLRILRLRSGRLCRLNARYYNPSTGRFLSRDPDLGGDTDRLSKNEYIYAYNNPINVSDADGHGFFNWLKKKYRRAKRYVKKKYRRAKRYVKKAYKRVRKAVRRTYRKARHWVKRKYRKAKRWVKKTYKKAKRWVKKTYKKVKRKAKKIARKVKKKVVGGIKAVGRAAISVARIAGQAARTVGRIINQGAKTVVDAVKAKFNGKKQYLVNVAGIKVYYKGSADIDASGGETQTTVNVSEDTVSASHSFGPLSVSVNSRNDFSATTNFQLYSGNLSVKPSGASMDNTISAGGLKATKGTKVDSWSPITGKVTNYGSISYNSSNLTNELGYEVNITKTNLWLGAGAIATAGVGLAYAAGSVPLRVGLAYMTSLFM